MLYLPLVNCPLNQIGTNYYKNITKTIHYAQPQSKSNMYPGAAGYVYDVPGCIKRTPGVLCRCFKARELPIVVERYVEAA